MDLSALPFEYEGRYGDLYRDMGLTMEQAAVLEQRDRDLEDYLAASVVPLIFHWPGTTADHVNVRNGPGEFRVDGTIYMIRYRWDTAPGTAATVKWHYDAAVSATMTHTLPASTNPHIERPGVAYEQQSIIGIVTAAGGGSGLTAFVYFR